VSVDPPNAHDDVSKANPSPWSISLEEKAAEFIKICQSIGDTVGMNRELSLAITNAEQAAMWALKGVSKLEARILRK
jgi:hypothetical protein